MASIRDLLNSLKSMELPAGAVSLLSSIGTEADAIIADRDDLRDKVETRQTENAQLKTRAQTAEADRDALKAKVPADDSVTLSKADAARWQSLSGKSSELGGVDKLLEKLGRVDTLEREQAQSLREQTIRSAGYDPKKLGRLIGETAFKVTGKGDDLQATLTIDDKDVSLTEWAEAEGITDVVNVMRLSAVPTRPPTPTGAGVRSPAPPQDAVDTLNKQLYGEQK